MSNSDEILNIGLELSMEFGKNWLTSINTRLSGNFPELISAELENYNEISKQVTKHAHNFICDNPVIINSIVEFPSFEKFNDFITEKFKWISNANVKMLYSQSCYYALK